VEGCRHSGKTGHTVSSQSKEERLLRQHSSRLTTSYSTPRAAAIAISSLGGEDEQNTELQNPEGFRCLQAPFFNAAIPVLLNPSMPVLHLHSLCNSACSKCAAAFGFPCFELAGPLPGSWIHHPSLPWSGPTAASDLRSDFEAKSEEQAGRGPCSCPASPPRLLPTRSDQRTSGPAPEPASVSITHARILNLRHIAWIQESNLELPCSEHGRQALAPPAANTYFILSRIGQPPNRRQDVTAAN